jgi:hypothetical protein
MKYIKSFDEFLKDKEVLEDDFEKVEVNELDQSKIKTFKEFLETYDDEKEFSNLLTFEQFISLPQNQRQIIVFTFDYKNPPKGIYALTRAFLFSINFVIHFNGQRIPNNTFIAFKSTQIGNNQKLLNHTKTLWSQHCTNYNLHGKDLFCVASDYDLSVVHF